MRGENGVRREEGAAASRAGREPGVENGEGRGVRVAGKRPPNAVKATGGLTSRPEGGNRSYHNDAR